MGTEMKDRYLEVLALLNMRDVAKETGRGYRTLQSYRLGERRITEAAVREMVKYLKERSDTLSAAADALASALEKEDSDE